jgi:hypothetical protein
MSAMHFQRRFKTMAQPDQASGMEGPVPATQWLTVQLIDACVSIEYRLLLCGDQIPPFTFLFSDNSGAFPRFAIH